VWARVKAIAIAPSRVEDRHSSATLHYDLSANYELFPRRAIHLQDCEMGYATGTRMCHQR